MGKFKTKVITDESQVPPGFRRIAALADSLSDQKRLSDAHTDGVIAAVKLMRSTDDRTGPVWVDAEAAARVLAPAEPVGKAKPASAGEVIDKRHAESVCESLVSIDSTLDEIYRVLERLTTAVESIATQPRRTDGDFKALAEDEFNDLKREIINGTHYS